MDHKGAGCENVKGMIIHLNLQFILERNNYRRIRHIFIFEAWGIQLNYRACVKVPAVKPYHGSK